MGEKVPAGLLPKEHAIEVEVVLDTEHSPDPTCTVTSDVTALKPVPVIVTVSPGLPTDGLIPVMVGVCAIV